jgi:hypothetical protein
VLLAALDTRSGGWDQEVAAELADIALLCIAKHKRRPTMMPVLRRLGALETKFCQPTLEELRLDALADTQRAELDTLRLQAQVSEMEVASAMHASMRTCILCYDDAAQSEGVTCAHEHFICNGCFGNYVKTEAEQAQDHPDLLRQREGKVCCPDGRHEPAYTEQQIARHVTDEVYTLHDQARQQVVRQGEFEAAQAQMQVEIRRMADQIRRSGGANVGPSPEVLARQLQQQMPNARMCGQCSFGPVDHQACWDLGAHQGEQVRGGGRINNACARCGWFSRDINDWPRWDGRLPDEVHQQHQAGVQEAGDALAATLEAASLEAATRVLPQQPRRNTPHAPQAQTSIAGDRDFALALQQQEQDALQIAALQRQLQEHERRQAEQAEERAREEEEAERRRRAAAERSQREEAECRRRAAAERSQREEAERRRRAAAERSQREEADRRRAAELQRQREQQQQQQQRKRHYGTYVSIVCWFKTICFYA